MSKELPYFRFTVQDWQNGKISLEDYETKGLFIDICGYYWINDCNITMAKLKKKFSNATILLQTLVDLGILKHEIKHDKVKIDFLDEQLKILSETRKHRQEAGSRGGKAKAKLKQNGGYKDKDKDKDKEGKKFDDLGNEVFFDEKWQIEYTIVDGERCYGNYQQRLCGGLSEFGIQQHCENVKIEYVK